jgi:hypothetical protein
MVSLISAGMAARTTPSSGKRQTTDDRAHAVSVLAGRFERHLGGRSLVCLTSRIRSEGDADVFSFGITVDRINRRIIQ